MMLQNIVQQMRIKYNTLHLSLEHELTKLATTPATKGGLSGEIIDLDLETKRWYHDNPPRSTRE